MRSAECGVYWRASWRPTVQRHSALHTPHPAQGRGRRWGGEGRRRRRRDVYRSRRGRIRRQPRDPQGGEYAPGSGGGLVSGGRCTDRDGGWGTGEGCIGRTCPPSLVPRPHRRARARHDGRHERSPRARRRARGARHHRRIRRPPVVAAPGPAGVVRSGARPRPAPGGAPGRRRRGRANGTGGPRRAPHGARGHASGGGRPGADARARGGGGVAAVRVPPPRA